MAVTEGAAEILPYDKSEVFYNPVQVFNRDLSIFVVDNFYKQREAGKIWQPKKGADGRSKLRIFEGLSASGLRSIRYAKELDCIDKIVVNDLSAAAVAQIKNNIKHNGMAEDPRIEASNADALLAMYQAAFGLNGGKYDVIDIDPYGSAAPFLDAAVQAVENGGLLCITSTDSRILCGNNPEVSMYKYGGTSLKGEFHHEEAIRVLLHAVMTAAAKHQRTVTPLVSASMDFYYRVFVQVRDSPKMTKRYGCNTSMLFQCNECTGFHCTPLGQVLVKGDNENFKPGVMTPSPVSSSSCSECGGNVSIGGPMYGGPLYDQQFIQSLRETAAEKPLEHVVSWGKIQGLLQAMSEEIDAPLFIHAQKFFGRFKLQAPSMNKIKGALVNLGYKASHFHREPQAVKTDAPLAVMYDLIRAYAKLNPPKKPSPALIKIMANPMTTTEEITFPDYMPPTTTTLGGETVERVAMFLPNPEKHWGPKKAASIKRTITDEADNKRPKVEEQPSEQ